jgi:hypothetical protein
MQQLQRLTYILESTDVPGKRLLKQGLPGTPVSHTLLAYQSTIYTYRLRERMHQNLKVVEYYFLQVLLPAFRQP